MSETIIARPYARAVFERARAQDGLAAWSEQLELLRQITADDRVAAALRSPHLTRARKAEMLVAICGDNLDKGGQNFVRLLAENGRLAVVGAIAEQFDRLRAQAENRIDAEVRSARELNETQRDHLAKALAKRLNQEVRLHCTVDEQLIGGVVVRAGDLVIDDSVKGRLQRLVGQLVH